MRKGIKIFLEKLKFFQNYQRFLRAANKEKLATEVTGTLGTGNTEDFVQLCVLDKQVS